MTYNAEDMKQRRARIRNEMGGLDKIERRHQRGQLTARERMDALLDKESFFELGTFTRSERAEVADRSPGDGKLTGLGTIDGRDVSVCADDATVFHASSAYVNSRRIHKAYELAVNNGHPLVYLGETGGARLPDTLGAGGFTRIHPSIATARRARQVPMVTAILGNSFGGSSFEAAFSDVVIQLAGTCLAVSSPRVIEIATGEKVSLEGLGGVDIHRKKTGQIDLWADTEEEALQLVRKVLSYLPQNRWSKPADLGGPTSAPPDEAIYDIVPGARNRAYDMHKLIARIVDEAEDGPAFVELKPDFGRPLINGLSRIGGKVVGIIASNPMYFAGALDPDSCDKTAQFICMCDAFNIPIVFLQDVPGFIVGRQAEHERLLHKAIMLLEALGLAETAKISIVIRKAFGLAYYALGGNDMGSDFVFAWPDAEISFMDPAVGVNIVYADKLQQTDDPDAERQRLIDEWSAETDPYGAAGIMTFDEIIDPAETRNVILRALRECDREAPPRTYRKPLASWPTCL